MTVTTAPLPASLSDLLITYGFSEVKAELWARFVGEAVAILEHAAAELRQTESWEAFGQKRGALSKPRTRKRATVVVRVPLEDAITAELGHIARRLRAALPSGHFLRLQEAAFETEHLVESSARTGRYSRKVDFFIYAQVGDSPPELAIEAKPLLANTDIAGRYLADEGIGCFFSADSVYTQQTVAAMLAYTINEGARPHYGEIRTAIAGFVPKPLAVQPVTLPPTTVQVLCSRHDRSTLQLDPVAIIHLEMLFAPEQNPL
ncbi:hypothetical protein LB526_05255 [Mesorhizobium sp. CA6]|uniref:hypothetical protein n=1 Tax=Mesorhizobium sp. CA6 TaxID=588500 RepID=UPI001CCECF28|nr:hypothetical protein [Mesorhizobium sp. CA6]MBZ9766163.1 hypothetical protein [Mesorhizobium sp. CA6]